MDFFLNLFFLKCLNLCHATRFTINCHILSHALFKQPPLVNQNILICRPLHLEARILDRVYM